VQNLTAATSGNLRKSPCEAKRELVLGSVALMALVVAELVLIFTIPGANYIGADGKAAQATILATLEFAGRFSITNLSPIQGIGSQMVPMNVWLNPAYWPFAIFDKEVAADISGIVALVCYAVACYVMARCFDLPRHHSIIAAQLCIILFGSAVSAIEFTSVFAVIPGLAVAYAPHVVAFGLLARVSATRPQVFVIGGGMLMLLFYSLSCDPLWTLVSGVAWVVPFAVVTLIPFRRDTILARCAVLGGCVVVLLLSGALEYVYTLSQYTSRVQFSQVLGRPRLPDHASILFTSWAAKYFYGVCVLGWLLGLWLQRGRARTLALAGAVSGAASLAYGAAYLLLDGTWSLPRPNLIEHALFPLFVTAAIAGYWGALEALAARARYGIQAMRMRSIPSWLTAVATVGIAVLIAAFIPAVVIVNAAVFPKGRAVTWYEPWPNEPELRQFLSKNIGLRNDRRFRGLVTFVTGGYDQILTLDNLWVDAVPTASEYNQLVTPQSIYFVSQMLKKEIDSVELNWFRPWLGANMWPVMFATFRGLGIRYITMYERLELFEEPRCVECREGRPCPTVKLCGAGLAVEYFGSQVLPRRPFRGEPGRWVVYELPDVNVGNYSPTEVTTAQSGAEISERLGAPNFDFARQVVLSGAITEMLVPARDMQLAVIRGGLHVSGHSDGTSLVVLPQQYSHCLRARDEHVRLVRANLMMTGMIFSGAVDTDIMFDYGIFTPRCRWADLSDIKQLKLQIDVRGVPSSGGRLFPGWQTAMAKLCAAAMALK
jgi:hypothetical protein